MSRIMVVDDRPANRDLVRAVLTHRGHTIIEADDAAYAFELLRRQPPDLIVTDVLMPAMDGYEFVRALRADASTRAMPVIFYSAYLSDEARPLAATLGVVGVVTKSGDIGALLDAVDAALNAAPEAPDHEEPERKRSPAPDTERVDQDWRRFSRKRRSRR
jgi:CheY-like chemotaxis protein